MTTMKSDFDGNSSESLYGSYSFVHDHKPYKGVFSSLDYSVSDTKWWLNLHGLETGGENKLIDEYYTYAKNDSDFCSDVPFAIDEDLLSNVLLTGLDSRPKKICLDLDSHWVGLKKTEPWWHAVDKDDLTSLVSQMSSHHNGSMNVEKVLDGCEICLDRFEEQMKDRSVGKRGLLECLLPKSDGAFSIRDGSNASKVDPSNTHEPSGGAGDLSRAQLLEALCHSQTRARKAEKSAQDACDEKDDIINLFFQQALCLFAYRQWLRLLQLETLCLHLRSQNRTENPGFLSRAQNKGPTLRRNRLRAEKMKRTKSRCYINKCAIAFAVGFGLASAGLLVGCTIGWIFPAL